MSFKMPKDFLWGVTTSAYQIEGAWDTDGKGESIWDRFSHTDGKIANGDTGDVACDHYHRYLEDIDLIADLVPNYRFSIAWTRIFPDGIGESVNQAGVDFYNRLIDALLAKGVTPWVTLYHWDLPQALQDKGGWKNREIVSWFEHYALTCARLFGDRVKNWVIINEPSVIAVLGHANGIFAPGLADHDSYWSCVHHQNLVMGNTYRALKAQHPDFYIGSAYTPVPARAEDPNDAHLCKTWENAWIWNYSDPLFKGIYPLESQEAIAPFIKTGDMQVIQGAFDYVGLQYYSPLYFKKDPHCAIGLSFGDAPADCEKNDLGWPIDPQAFTDMLLKLRAEYGDHDWIITENGISLNDTRDHDAVSDPRRIDYLSRHIDAVKNAMQQGVTIKGYFAWSLLDNMEWASGYGPRFGLVYIDYKDNLKRIPKDSYYWFQKRIAV
jgi:beta-glucosidase